MKFRRTHTPTAYGLVTISIQTMSNKTTVWTSMDCKLQAKILGIWITIKNYSISMNKYVEEKPMKMNVKLERIDETHLLIKSVKFDGEK